MICQFNEESLISGLGARELAPVELKYTLSTQAELYNFVH